MTVRLPATWADLGIPGRLPELVGRRAGAMSGPVQTILVAAALTDVLFRLVARSRTVVIGRASRTTDIEGRLREFERAWEQATGEHLTTPAFYDRFCAGDFDTRFGARWATYYEATLANPEPRDGLSHLGLHRPDRG